MPFVKQKQEQFATKRCSKTGSNKQAGLHIYPRFQPRKEVDLPRFGFVYL